jgi:hypothetical protein
VRETLLVETVRNTLQVVFPDNTSQETISTVSATVVIEGIGIQGPAGGQIPPYLYIQSEPAILWLVNHNFGWYPLVSIFTPGGVEVTAEVRHVSTNQFSVSFSSPQTGRVVAR